MAFILPVVFTALLFWDFRASAGKEKVIYIVLSVSAVILALFAAMEARDDHIGASLAGMISIFMR
ncbi:MAG: hypothetical protein II996_02770 [Oscillospiraceae bacterium]|nr:hypothetical protein [Oscillospiraceae bacterium]MBQ4544477.1 hypothetical protein [Oscillospiraceae bacterium]MBQ6697845.1 hypothetical protein [Oscillospiraceae bacterium]MBQ6902473.1 hypothetical protein [Oscillospiraceae bacterium]